MNYLKSLIIVFILYGCQDENASILNIYYEIPKSIVNFDCADLEDNKELRKRKINWENKTNSYLEFSLPCGDGPIYLKKLIINNVNVILMLEYHSSIASNNFGLTILKYINKEVALVEEQLFVDNLIDIEKQILEINKYPQIAQEFNNNIPLALQFSEKSNQIIVTLHPELDNYGDEIVFGEFNLIGNKYKFNVAR